MKIVDFIKLKWLRTVASEYLHPEESVVVYDYASRYQEGTTPTFTDEETVLLDSIYSRVKSTTSSVSGGISQSEGFEVGV